MANVYCSVAETLAKRSDDIMFRTQNNFAIYGTADFSQVLITQKGIGVRPTLSGDLIDEKGPSKISTGKYGDAEGYYYSINKDGLTKEALDVATKDDLYLYVTMAPPSVLKSERLKSLIFERLSKVYEEELAGAGENAEEVKKQQEADKEKVMHICDSVGKAVKGPGYEIYYAEGYQPEEENQPV